VAALNTLNIAQIHGLEKLAGAIALVRELIHSARGVCRVSAKSASVLDIVS
jgi:hypothetical protein